MPDPQTAILVVVAFATLVVPAAFLVALLGAVLRRRTGHEPGPAWTGTIAFLGGASLGTMFLIANDVVVGAPLALVVVWVAISQWRSGRRTLAALLVLGAGLPWTLLWAAHMVLFSRGVVELDPAEAVVGFLAGAVPTTLALIALAQERMGVRRSAARTGADRPAGEPANGATIVDRTRPRVVRSFRIVGEAMREPSRLGPFGLPEVAALVVLVASGLALTGLAVLGLPPLVGYGLAVIVGSALATEAYLRSMAPRTRRSMEAFMWLGSWELGQVRAATGAGVPTTPRGAAQWLVRHPESPDEAAMLGSLRVDLELLAGRADDARAAAGRLPGGTPLERFHKAAAADVVAWWAGSGDGLEAMAAALDDLAPSPDDDRLRAEVALAIARVRHLAVAIPPVPDPLAPLLDVRERLGARADGVVRRILWPRLYRVFVLASIALAIIGLVTGISAPLP